MWLLVAVLDAHPTASPAWLCLAQAAMTPQGAPATVELSSVGIRPWYTNGEQKVAGFSAEGPDIAAVCPKDSK